ncbi:hypothetical protein ACOME3_006780 [Neoechinorhynchus agilis]
MLSIEDLRCFTESVFLTEYLAAGGERGGCNMDQLPCILAKCGVPCLEAEISSLVKKYKIVDCFDFLTLLYCYCDCIRYERARYKELNLEFETDMAAKVSTIQNLLRTIPALLVHDSLL